MTTNEILTRLGEPTETIPSLEQQYTYADDSGHRRPHPLAEAVAIGKQVGVSERTAKRYLKALSKGLFINRLEKGHYQRCNKNT
ncbi:MAG: hypothetical protein IKV24_00065 [Bacteroidaceae bacterium]|nr:hypothetical protein [Bacteroidaceae bacterium]